MFLSACPCMCVSVYLCVWLCVCVCVCMSMCVSMCVFFVCLCLYVCSVIFFSTCYSVHVCINLCVIQIHSMTAMQFPSNLTSLYPSIIDECSHVSFYMCLCTCIYVCICVLLYVRVCLCVVACFLYASYPVCYIPCMNLCNSRIQRSIHFDAHVIDRYM